MYDLLYLINHVIPAITIAYVTYVWTETNAFYEYLLKWKPFSYLPCIKEYIKENDKFTMDFNTYLKVNDNKFIYKLLSCPFCVIFWSSLLTGLIGGYNVFALAFLAYVLFKAL